MKNKESLNVVGINIDGVIRDMNEQFDKQYRKIFIHNPSLVEMTKEMQAKERTDEEQDDLEKIIELKTKELISLPLKSYDLTNHYRFEQTVALDGETILSPQEALEDFMLNRFQFQIFGQAETYKGASDAFNKIQSYGLDNKVYETVLLTSYGGQALQATFHFLATHGIRTRYFRHVENEYDKWKYCDVLIDCVPEIIQDVPDNKILLKVEQPFNSWDSATHSFKSLSDIHPSFIEDLLVGESKK